ncbi:MAG TPA: nickel-dependent hydrogenase large subunit [Spirochaetota bacterium]|nr:nickel-dependent hydrogenase large subunit [Spirochaetota bacterium]HOD15353.1 nickel-dependent hydrogenase large subunit [Spirochaetota bacterium]HPG51397.1 nickel-dependent hydrogenase large subunit [Spirochaetota bacterium]HPN11772.1 nickel-dependent hydrogenase large subunit [Spirochaetota bacterium]
MAKVLIDPITRIEGHLSIEIDVQNGKVVDAKSIGDMFRGFERIFVGRNPLDANQLSQRICGVCPISHGIASSKCLEGAFGIKPNNNGRILRNMMLGANYLHSHLIHFYHLAALDYVDITALLKYKGGDSKINNLKSWVENELKVKKGRADAMTAGAPFLPRYEGNFYIKDVDTNISAIAGYVKALEMRMKAHKMVAAIGGRAPHAIGLVPGGVTQVPTRAMIREYKKHISEIQDFINDVYMEHVIAVAKTFKDYFKIGAFTNFMSYGLFDLDNEDKKFMLQRGVAYGTKLGAFDPNKIKEQVQYSRYSSGSNLHPYDGQTVPNPQKGGAYTWLKAPRYEGNAMEVGPLARVVVSYLSGNTAVKTEVDALLKMFNADISAVFSVLGRHAARAIEAKLIAAELRNWIDELEVNGKPRSTFDIPESGEGMGLVEASRGALGHWIRVKDRKIANYQAVVPTTWFCGPRGDDGKRGPVEEALMNTPIADPNNPIEAARVVRSFDPCIACAVHVVEGDREIGTFKVC